MRSVARETDVLVVGAGPAGAAAAALLAANGRDVTVIDKATFPRDKCCGDGLTTLALRELETIGFDPGAVTSWTAVDAAFLRSPSGREVCLPLVGRGLYAAVAPRLELDNALVDHARAAGAKVLGGHGFVAITSDEPDSVVVEVADVGAVRARYVVAADGMWSQVRKALNAGTPGPDGGAYLGEWHGFRQYARNVTGPARERLYVWFDADLIPGYAWSFPLAGNRANVGFGLLRDGRPIRDMKQIWSDLLQRPHIQEALGPSFEMQARHTAWPIPARIDQAVLALDRVLFVGDSAMATDPLTGEGIGQALLTGRLAAEAIINAGAMAADRARQLYERSVRHHLLADHRMSILLSRVLASDFGARGSVKVIGLNDWTRRNVARWMFEDEPRAIALTPRRWHRRLFSRNGAYVDAVEAALSSSTPCIT